MQNPVSELTDLLTSAKSLTKWVTLCVLPHCLLHFHCSGKMNHCNWLEKRNPVSLRNVLTSRWMFPHVVSESFKYIYLPLHVCDPDIVLGSWMVMCVLVCTYVCFKAWSFLLLFVWDKNAAPLLLSDVIAKRLFSQLSVFTFSLLEPHEFKLNSKMQSCFFQLLLQNCFQITAPQTRSSTLFSDGVPSCYNSITLY